MVSSGKIYIRPRVSRLLIAVIAVLSFAIGFGLRDHQDKSGGDAVHVATHSQALTPSAQPQVKVPAGVPAMNLPAAQVLPQARSMMADEAATPSSRERDRQVRREAPAFSMTLPHEEVQDVTAPSPDDATPVPLAPVEIAQTVATPPASPPAAVLEIQHASFQSEGEVVASLAEDHALSDQELAAVSPDPYGGVKTIALADPIS